jgi:hypothetical protein
VRPAERGGFLAPASEVEAVWARIVVRAGWGDDASIVLDETASRDFLVDDDSGEIAHVDPRGAIASFANPLEPDTATIGLRRVRFDAFSPRLVDYLRSRGWCRNPGEGDDLVVDEITLEPGDTVVVVGRAGRTPGADGATRLVLPAGGLGARSLLLARRSPKERRSTSVFATGAAIAGFGLVLAVLSVLSHSR